MKRRSTPLITKEAQIKTTMRHHFSHPLKQLLLKKKKMLAKNTCGEIGAFVHRWQECKTVLLLWKTAWGVPQKLNLGLPSVPAIPSWVYTRKK